ncbi:hypothetical protein F4859DRAFT_514531 [Xylaria cf. heliscus]|nr:hypothetical protein F4859DRAFT_514531 [Xylaria cf. heliscus]
MKSIAIVVAIFATGTLSAPVVTLTRAEEHAKFLSISPYKNFVDAADPHKVLGE